MTPPAPPPPARVCIYCKRAKDDTLGPDGKVLVELRPYGPGGALVCFHCAMNPEHAKETARQYRARLDAAGPIVLLTDEGPAPGQEYVRDLLKPPKERA